MAATILASLAAMGGRLVTASVIEKLMILLAEQLVNRTASKVDDQAFEIIKNQLEGK